MARYHFRILAVALLFALAAVGVATGAEEIKTLEIGAQAPDFALPGVDGKLHKLADYQDAKVLVIVFTCNHCPTAQAYEVRIKKLVTDYKDKGVALVAISPNDPNAVRLDELGYTDVSDSLDDMKIRFKDKQWNFPYLYDGENQKVSKAYGPVSTPHVFIFDEQRKLRYAGRVDNNERDPKKVTSRDTRNAIEALLKGEPVPVETTRTFGCSIKWASKRGSVAQSLEQWAKEPVRVAPVGLDGIKALLKNDTREAACDQCLGDVLRAVRGRVPRVGYDQSHVPQPRFRNGEPQCRRDRQPGQGPGLPSRTNRHRSQTPSIRTTTSMP